MANLGINKIVAQAQAAAQAASAAANAAVAANTRQQPQQAYGTPPAPYRTGGQPYVIDPLVTPGTRLVPEGWNLLDWLSQTFNNTPPGTVQVGPAPNPQSGYTVGPLIPEGVRMASPGMGWAPAQQDQQPPAVPPAVDQVIPYPPVQAGFESPEMADWLLNYANTPGTIMAPGAVAGPGTKTGPSVTQFDQQTQAIANLQAGQPVSAPVGDSSGSGAAEGGMKGAEAGKKAQDTSSTTPAGPPGEMFLMRPRGLSGPDGEREKAIQLTDYEGLADNARARRLSWGEYNKLTEDERAAADLNKLLVRSRESDLESGGKMKPAREAQYAADVAEVFGTEGTKSTTAAPRLVGLLADLDIDAAGKDLDDFLSLREGISAGDIDRGEVQMDLANRVQEKANTAFQEFPDKYWNLNSAVRGLEPKGAKYAPPGFGKGKQPAQGKWNEEMLYENLWRGVTEGDPAWTVEKAKSLLGPETLNLDNTDWDRLNEAMYLRVQNAKLYGGGQSKTMSSDDTKKRRSPDEVMQFLAEVRRK